MGFKYFKGKSWIDISREERLYCAHLYFQIKSKELEFVKWLNVNKNMKLPEDVEWEVGYEVCLYRDYFKHFREDSIKDNKEYPQKRTFDLCLFSVSNIVIIEAKVQQGFESEQSGEFLKDELFIKKLLKSDIKVDMLLLASSKYYKNYPKHGKKETLDGFNFRISWMELYNHYSNNLYLKADRIYKN